METSFRDWFYEDEFAFEQELIKCIDSIVESVTFSQAALHSDPYLSPIQDYWESPPEKRSKYQASYNAALAEIFNKHYRPLVGWFKRHGLGADQAEEYAAQLFTWLVERWGRSQEEEEANPRVQGPDHVPTTILAHLKTKGTNIISNQKKRGGDWDVRMQTLSPQGGKRGEEGNPIGGGTMSPLDVAASSGSSRGRTGTGTEQPYHNLAKEESRRAMYVALQELRKRDPQAWWVIKKQWIDRELESEEYGGFGTGAKDKGYEATPKDMDADQVLAVDPSQVGRGMKNVLFYLWDQWDKVKAGQPNNYPMHPDTGKPMFYDKKTNGPPGWVQVSGSIRPNPGKEYSPEKWRADPAADEERKADPDKVKVAVRKLTRISITPPGRPNALKMLRQWWAAEMGLDAEDIKQRLTGAKSTENWAKRFAQRKVS